MRTRTKRWIRIGCAAWAVAAVAVAQDKRADDALETTRRLVAAFDAHDAAAMAALVSDDFELYWVDGGETSLGARGPEELEAQMIAHFRAHPTARSEIVASIAGPRFVAFRERAHHPVDGQERSKTALAVYEVAAGEVVRAWYFESDEEEGGAPS